MPVTAMVQDRGKWKRKQLSLDRQASLRLVTNKGDLLTPVKS